MAKRLCLPKENREKLAKALKSGDLRMEKLDQMGDKELKTVFKQYVGEDFADLVTAKFEQARVSNQKNAYKKWIMSATSKKDPVRRDMLKRVERNKKYLTPDEQTGFNKALAEDKLGLNVTEQEAKTLLNFKKNVDELKAKWNPARAEQELAENARDKNAGWTSEEDRLAYGFALDDIKTFIGDLKKETRDIKFAERFKPTNYWKNIADLAGATKSMVATLDNSFLGRQGIKTLLRGDFAIWGKTVKNSFKDFGKELVAKSGGLFKERSDGVMRAIRADIYSRPNALNGKYKAAKNGYGLGVLHEEAFPSSLPERIPLLGRIFKASETAFNGSALRMRGDLADAVIAQAEKNGVDMLDEAQATAHGKFVSSMTGRGEIGRLGAVGEEINVLMFSVKFLKSNFDTITAHQFDRTMTPEAKKLAAKSTMRIAGSLTALLSTAKMLGFDVEFDPRSTRFGQICSGNHCYDPTGGMRGLITLGSRIVPTFHNGEFGFWSKTSTTGKWTKMTGDNFGERTALDTFESFFEGKASPLAGAFRDIWRGQKFGGEKPTFVNTTIGLITPISAEMFVEELEKGNDDIALAMIAEAVGIGVTETTFGGYGKRWQELKETESTENYNKALKQVTERFNERADKLKKAPRWDRMDNDEKSKELDRIRREETDRALGRYGL